MKTYEIEVRVVVSRWYSGIEAENVEEAKEKFYNGEGFMHEEDDDTWEIVSIEEV